MILVNANIIDIRTGHIMRDANMIIENGLIKQIANKLTIHDQQYIDCQGGFIIPGLIDMHTHLGPSVRDLSNYLKHGVTTIRNMIGIDSFSLKRWMCGTRLFSHLQLKQKIIAGEISGPDIITAGPLLDGEKSVFPDFMIKKILNTAAAKAEVERQYSEGYDFIKIYPALSDQVFMEIMNTANKLGIKVTGHVPYETGLRRSLAAGLFINEHLHGLIYPLRPHLNPTPEEKATLMEYIQNKGSWICPTLVAWQRLGNKEHINEFRKELHFRQQSFRIRMGMELLNNVAVNYVEKNDLQPQFLYLDELFSLINQFPDKTKVLAGTDTSVPFVTPGASLIQEILLLSKAGLSNLEAIQSATINPASALMLENKIGTIESGKNADIVVLAENPLNNLSALTKRLFIFKRGILIGADNTPFSGSKLIKEQTVKKNNLPIF